MIKLDSLADFEIKRDDHIFTVKVSERRGKDQIDRIKITVINKQNKKDEDYLVIRNTGQSPEALKQYLTDHLAVQMTNNEGLGREKIASLALDAEPVANKRLPRSRSVNLSSAQKRFFTQQKERPHGKKAILEADEEGKSPEESKDVVRIDDLIKKSSLPPINERKERGSETPEIIEITAVSESRGNENSRYERAISTETSKFEFDSRAHSPVRRPLSPERSGPSSEMNENEKALRALLDAQGPDRDALLQSFL